MKHTFKHPTHHRFAAAFATGNHHERYPVFHGLLHPCQQLPATGTRIEIFKKYFILKRGILLRNLYVFLIWSCL